MLNKKNDIINNLKEKKKLNIITAISFLFLAKAKIL